MIAEIVQKAKVEWLKSRINQIKITETGQTGTRIKPFLLTVHSEFVHLCKNRISAVIFNHSHSEGQHITILHPPSSKMFLMFQIFETFYHALDFAYKSPATYVFSTSL